MLSLFHTKERNAMNKKERSKEVTERLKARGVRGKATVGFLGRDEFKKVFTEFRRLVSPSFAAERLHVSRSYIKQLEKEGKIRVYRVRAEDINWADLPGWAWFIIPPKKKLFVFIPEEDVEAKRQAMVRRAEKRVEELSDKE